jgi:hypothetical protein
MPSCTLSLYLTNQPTNHLQGAQSLLRSPSRLDTHEFPNILWNPKVHCCIHSQTLSWRTAPCRLFATAYSIRSLLPSTSGDHLLYPQPVDVSCFADKGVCHPLYVVLTFVSEVFSYFQVFRSKFWTHFSFPRAFYTFSSLSLLDFITVVINIKGSENYKILRGAGIAQSV